MRLAIDRLVAAGIVSGTEPAIFEPWSNVSRWQMALFLDRLIDRAAIPSTPRAVRFTDLDGVPSEAVEAIAALEAIEIFALHELNRLQQVQVRPQLGCMMILTSHF